MPQCGASERFDIVDAHMTAAFEQSTRFGPQYQKLTCPSAGTPTGPLINKIRCPALARARCGGKPYSVADQLFSDGNLANNVVEMEHILTSELGLDGGGSARGCASDHRH